MKPYVVCTRCHVPHIENCGSCFGFGVKRAVKPIDDLFVPITAAAARSGSESIRIGALACPECGSTLDGYSKRGKSIGRSA